MSKSTATPSIREQYALAEATYEAARAELHKPIRRGSAQWDQLTTWAADKPWIASPDKWTEEEAGTLYGTIFGPNGPIWPAEVPTWNRSRNLFVESITDAAQPTITFVGQDHGDELNFANIIRDDYLDIERDAVAVGEVGIDAWIGGNNAGTFKTAAEARAFAFAVFAAADEHDRVSGVTLPEPENQTDIDGTPCGWKEARIASGHEYDHFVDNGNVRWEVALQAPRDSIPVDTARDLVATMITAIDYAEHLNEARGETLINEIAERLAEKCPRCGGPLRQFLHDHGALSRIDNETIICGSCGGAEALAGN